MLTRVAWNEWRDGRINDSVLCGLLDGGRDDDGGRSRSVWGRAAAKKGQQLLGRMVLRRTVSIKRLGGDEAGEKAFGRFLRNKRVSEAALITAAKSHLSAQVAGRRVLAIQDTSEINFSRHTRSKTAFGRGGNGTDAAFFVHPVLAVDADSNVILGLADVQLWQRHGTAAKEASRTTDEKNPRRWLAGAEAAASLRAAGSTAVTVVADREGDLYPAFARRPGAVELLVGAQTERGLAGGGYLFAHLDGLPIADRFILDLPAIPGRSARRAAMVLRYGPVSLSRPRNSADRNLPATVALYALDVREIEAPAGVEPSIGAFCPVLLSILLRRRTRRSPTTAAAGISSSSSEPSRAKASISKIARSKRRTSCTRSPSSPCAPPLCACSLFMRAAAPISGRPSLPSRLKKSRCLKPSPPPSTARPTALKIPSRRDRCLGRLGSSLASAHGAVPRAPNHPAP